VSGSDEGPSSSLDLSVGGRSPTEVAAEVRGPTDPDTHAGFAVDVRRSGPYVRVFKEWLFPGAAATRSR
jgi:hypothetical protein